MTYLFIGAEDTDFVMPITNWTWYTSAGTYSRSTITRGAHVLYGSQSQSAIEGNFIAASSSFWFTCRLYYELPSASSGPGGRPFLIFSNGTNKRIAIGMDQTQVVRVYRYDALGALEELANGMTAGSTAYNTVTKFDVQIAMGNPGLIRVYATSSSAVPPTLIYEYTGQTTVAGQPTTINKVGLTNPNIVSNYFYYYSEVIAAERDTRTLSLYSLRPSSTGSGNQWTGSASDIDDDIANGTDVISTTAADRDAFFELTDLPTGNYSVQAVKVSSQGARGATGPTGLQIGLRANGTTSLGTINAMDTTWTKQGEYFEVNPGTGLVWTPADINAMQVAARSKT